MSVIKSSYVSCFWLFLVSIAGGVVLGWWEIVFRPSNSQLWMVPFGLVVLLTPVVIFFTVFISDLCNSSDDASQKLEKQSVAPVHHDQEK